MLLPSLPYLTCQVFIIHDFLTHVRKRSRMARVTKSDLLVTEVRECTAAKAAEGIREV